MKKHPLPGTWWLACAAFLSLGLPDGLLGVGWPYIRNTFLLPVDAIGVLLVLSTLGYLASSFTSGRILNFLSIGNLLWLSCAATGITLVGYAIAPLWGVMVALAIVAGLGAGAIDAGLNTYAANHLSARSVSWLHACYGLGAALGPILMTEVLMANRSWRAGYGIVGTGQLLLAVGFVVTARRWESTPAIQLNGSAPKPELLSTLRLPAVWNGIAAFFFYTGLEAAAGIWSYTFLTEKRGIGMESAGFSVSVYWGCLMLGRIISGFTTHKLTSAQILRCCFAGSLLGALLLYTKSHFWLNFTGLALLGFSFAPIFPTLISATPERVGNHAANAIGIQIAAAVLGQSLIPAFTGLLARWWTIEGLLVVLLAGIAILVVLERFSSRA